MFPLMVIFFIPSASGPFATSAEVEPAEPIIGAAVVGGAIVVGGATVVGVVVGTAADVGAKPVEAAVVGSTLIASADVEALAAPTSSGGGSPLFPAKCGSISVMYSAILRGLSFVTSV